MSYITTKSQKAGAKVLNFELNTKSLTMPNSKSQKDSIEDIYVIEQTPDMKLEELVEKIKIKVQQVLSETANDPKHNNN